MTAAVIVISILIFILVIAFLFHRDNLIELQREQVSLDKNRAIRDQMRIISSRKEYNDLFEACERWEENPTTGNEQNIKDCLYAIRHIHGEIK